jgi:hypothetical protein
LLQDIKDLVLTPTRIIEAAVALLWFGHRGRGLAVALRRCLPERCILLSKRGLRLCQTLRIG